MLLRLTRVIRPESPVLQGLWEQIGGPGCRAPGLLGGAAGLEGSAPDSRKEDRPSRDTHGDFSACHGSLPCSTADTPASSPPWWP